MFLTCTKGPIQKSVISEKLPRFEKIDKNDQLSMQGFYLPHNPSSEAQLGFVGGRAPGLRGKGTYGHVKKSLS